jgi:hypothetical protein
MYSKIEIDKYMLENGLNIEELYFLACKNGLYKIVFLLKSLYPELDLLYRYKLNCIHVCSVGSLELLLFLERLGNLDYDKLLRVSLYYGHLKIANYLCDKIVDLSINDNLYLKLAISKGHTNIAVKILSRHSIKSLDYRNIMDWTIRNCPSEKISEMISAFTNNNLVKNCSNNKINKMIKTFVDKNIITN